MPNFSDYTDSINLWIDNIEFPTTPAGLYEPIKYMLSGGGKRIRPALLCATAEAFGLKRDAVKNQALGVEMFHNFTLLHDDVMDNADVRHGIPTVHKKWDVSTAILSGDTMLSLATVLTADCDKRLMPKLLSFFNKTAIEVYEGQQFDMNFEHERCIDIDDYLKMIRLKTAVLIGYACKAGAMLAEASEHDIENFYNYGIYVGLAFQLRDDYLDTFGDEQLFGKAIGGDILNDKNTWLRVMANKSHDDALQTLSTNLVGEEKISAVKQLYIESEVDAKCLEQIKLYTTIAIKYLNDVENINDEYRKFFSDFALSAVKRLN